MTDADFPVVHALALRKRSDLEGLVRATALEAAAIEAALGRAIEAKLVLAARGNYFVTPDGDRVLRSAYAERFAAERADPSFVDAYDRFEQVNRVVKSLVTEWQMRAVGGQQVVNDHSDSAYDDRVLDRLSEAHERAERLISELAARLPRLSRYNDRLAAALDRADEGEHEWVSGVRCDSYHTVWFELHEDLLRILGRERTEG